MSYHAEAQPTSAPVEGGMSLSMEIQEQRSGPISDSKSLNVPPSRRGRPREVTYLRGYINVLPVWSDLHNLLIAYSILVPALASGTHGYMVSSAIRQCSHNELIGNDHGKTFSSCLPNQLNPGDLYQSIAYCLVPRKKPLHFGAQRSLLREPKIHGGRL